MRKASFVRLLIALPAVAVLLGSACPQNPAGEPAAVGDGGTTDGGANGGPALVEGDVGCLHYAFNYTPADLTPSSLVRFALSLVNICQQPLLVNGKVYVQLTGPSGETVTVPLRPLPSPTVQIAPGQVATEADFRASLGFNVAEEPFWSLFSGGAVTATGVFQGQISGGDFGGDFFTANLTLALQTQTP